VRLWKATLAALPSDVAHALAHRNAERLWRIPAAGSAAARPSGPPATSRQTPPEGQLNASGEAVGPKGLTAAEVVRRLDGDGDGRISPAEFRRPQRAFNKIDADQDGFLTAAEFADFWQPKRP